MISDFILMNGYGPYVWSAFLFTLLSFSVLYLLIGLQLRKEQQKFAIKFQSLNLQKVELAKKQKINKEILAKSLI